MSGRLPLFVECGVCGERWKLATLPLPASVFVSLGKSTCCPNCSERKKVFMCPTDGPNAVVTAREGKAVAS